MDIGLNVSLDTSTKGTFTVIPTTTIAVPSNEIFYENASYGQNVSKLKETMPATDMLGGFIESILKFTGPFNKFVTTVLKVITSIHDTAAPFFGDYNAWIIQGIVDFIFCISLIQIITGRSFKTME